MGSISIKISIDTIRDNLSLRSVAVKWKGTIKIIITNTPRSAQIIMMIINQFIIANTTIIRGILIKGRDIAAVRELMTSGIVKIYHLDSMCE